MASPVILGVDPGFASFGWSAVRLDAPPEVLAAGVIRTKKDAVKQSLLAAEDNVVRCREIYEQLRRVISEHAPAALAAESMSFPRNASTAAKVALTWGVIVAVAEMHQLPLLQVSPQYVKKKVAGARDASKNDVAAAVEMATHGTTAENAVFLSGLGDGMREHMYDAMAVVLAVLDNDLVRMLRR